MSMMETLASQALAEAVRRSGAPGAVGCLGHREDVVFLGAAGLRQRVPQPAPAQVDTPYDLASLTKVVATTTAVLRLVQEGKLKLEQPIADFVQLSGMRGITVRHLLSHTSGLPAHEALYREVHSFAEMIARIPALERDAPPGTRRRYSDFGFMLLAHIVASVSGEAFDVHCARTIFQPLGMADTAFNPAPAIAQRAAATEQCAWRGRLLVGEVHDENASAMGGVSGHAGLFSTAPDLVKFCTALLGGQLLNEATLDLMLRPVLLNGYRWQGLGWKLDGWMRSNEGYLPSRQSFGHTGWTGTSLWLDRDTRRYAILLSNTCHPTRGARDNQSLRQVFHVPVSRRWYPQRCNTQTGLDQLAVDAFDALRGKRVGLLTNTGAVDAGGRGVVEVLREGGVNLRRLFSPEHGLRGQAEAGAEVASEAGALPVTSLYGQQTAPTPEELAGVDVFVIDLPDVGARYYTYAATMLDCMRACAAARVPVVVLDRPNPLGGEVMEGPVAQVFGKNVCVAPVPVRHGMTLGEFALFLHRTLPDVGGVAPSVIAVDNWPRELMAYSAGLPWRAPSPNIPDMDTALLYVGNCLFEGVNLNEGRGTPWPFQVCGAPWLGAARVLAALDRRYALGVTVEATRYVPAPIAGRAAKPAYNGETCEGLRFTLYDRDAARPFMLAVAVLRAVMEVHGEALVFVPFFDTLAGGPWLREQLQAGARLDGIADVCAAQCREFHAKRVGLYASSDALVDEFL
jgi:uncharacterized protein YbbC (DUF1343 family)/CubicO group peptidase (beta-lactamase class C family)